MQQLGFACEVLTQARRSRTGRFSTGERIEDESLPTVLGYGHGDVIRMSSTPAGARRPQSMDAGRAATGATMGAASSTTRASTRSISPHSAPCCPRAAASASTIKWLIETGEETGSPGLREVCTEPIARRRFKADVLIASDGPRLSVDRPTMYLGCRGAFPIDFTIRGARRRPSLRQLGRALVQSGDPAVPRARERGQCERTDQHHAVEARADQQLRAQRAGRLLK